MLQSLAFVFRHPSIRAAALTLFLLGCSSSASYPYLSLVAIGDLHMSDVQYSQLMIIAAIASVLISVSLGAMSDHVADRKPMILMTTATGILGYGLFFLFPSIPFFMALTLLFSPIAGSTFSLLFSSVRAETGDMSTTDAGSVTSAVRMFFSAAYMLVPGVVGLWLVQRTHMTDAFGISALGMIFCFSLFLIFGRSSKNAGQTAQKKPGFRETVRLLSSKDIVLPILALAILTAPQRMNATISPLIMTGKLGGSSADVGLIAGGLALLELPCLMLWGSLQRRTSNPFVLVSGGLVYVAYLIGLGFATTPWQVYALLSLNAIGSSALLSVPMSYLQELMPARPGLGTSLLLLSVFVCDALNAAAFAIGTMVTDYAGTALIGAGITAVGCGMIWGLERGKRS